MNPERDFVAAFAATALFEFEKTRRTPGHSSEAGLLFAKLAVGELS